MAGRPKSLKGHRKRLTRERVVMVAIKIADADGLAAVSMRKVAQHLGVEAMSLYNHIANKDDLFGGMVDHVFSEIALSEQKDWRGAMCERASSARKVLMKHVWSISLMDARRQPGLATLRHHDWFIGTLRNAGFSLPMAAHAFALIDGFIYGFVLQESALPSSSSGEMTEVAQEVMSSLPIEQYPHLAELTDGYVLKPGYNFGDSFEFGLDLILDGLERHRCKETP